KRHALASAALHRRRQHGREPYRRRRRPEEGRQHQRRALRRAEFDYDTEVISTMFDKTSGDNSMRSSPLRVLSFSAIAALALSPALWPALAAETDASQAASAQAAAKETKEAPLVTGSIGPVKTRFLALGVGKSVVVDLPREAKDVLVADPKIANAVIRSAQRAYIIGA